MGSRTFHVNLSVRGAIKNFKASNYRNCVRHPTTGRYMTPSEVRDWLLDELAKGHECVPLSDPCEGFDYSGGGCPGHEIPSDETQERNDP